MKPSLTPSKKTFQQEGKWVEHRPSMIIVCTCGNKYIKTRNLQTKCIRCMAKSSKEK